MLASSAPPFYQHSCAPPLLLITLIIEDYRVSAGNSYLQSAFPKPPISFAVMPHPPCEIPACRAACGLQDPGCETRGVL